MERLTFCRNECMDIQHSGRYKNEHHCNRTEYRRTKRETSGTGKAWTWVASGVVLRQTEVSRRYYLTISREGTVPKGYTAASPSGKYHTTRYCKAWPTGLQQQYNGF